MSEIRETGRPVLTEDIAVRQQLNRIPFTRWGLSQRNILLAIWLRGSGGREKRWTNTDVVQILIMKKRIGTTLMPMHVDVNGAYKNADAHRKRALSTWALCTANGDWIPAGSSHSDGTKSGLFL
jgi:hypothetical protein